MTRRFLAVLAPVLAIAAVAAVAVPRLPSLLTPRLEAALSRSIGHDVAIKGGLQVGWAGGLTIDLRDVAVANAPWGSRPDMLVAPRVTVVLDGPALLRGTVSIQSARLDSPDALLETNADGRGNWQMAAAPARPADSVATPSTGAAPDLRIGVIEVAGGHVTFRDGVSHRVFAASLDATARADRDPVPVTATLRAPNADLRVQADIARVDPWQRSRASVTGQLLAPEPIDIAASLTPGQAGLVVTGQAHGTGLEVAVSGVLDPASLQPVGPVGLDVALADGASLAAAHGAPTPSSLHVLLRRQGDGVTLRDLRAVLPAGTVTGDLDVGFTTPLTLRGSLSSQSLDLPTLLAWPTPTPAASAPSAPQPAAAPPPPAISPLFRWLGLANADLRAAIAEAHDGAVVLRDVSGHLVLQDGVLALDPLAGDGPGGRVSLTAHVESRAAPPTLAVSLHAPALEPNAWMTLAGLPADIDGVTAVDADLRTTGASAPEWLRGLEGRASITMRDGDIDLRRLGDMLAATRLPINAHGRAHLRCLLVRANVAQGVATLAPLLLDATGLVIQGGGHVDLVQRTLALRLRPLLRTGPGLIVPVTLSGNWARPKLDVDPAGLAGVVEGLAKSGGDPCRDAGLASSAPLPATKKLKPADLLRSLLR